MPAEIRIDDLLHPQLNQTQKAALAHGDATPVELSENAIIAEAKKRTGLSDFGPDDFRERLRAVVEEWNADPGLSDLHRITLWGYITRHMANRLLIQDCAGNVERICELLKEIDQPKKR